MSVKFELFCLRNPANNRILGNMPEKIGKKYSLHDCRFQKITLMVCTEVLHKLSVFHGDLPSCDLFKINVQLCMETKYTLRPPGDMQAFLKIVNILFLKEINTIMIILLTTFSSVDLSLAK